MRHRRRSNCAADTCKPRQDRNPDSAPRLRAAASRAPRRMPRQALFARGFGRRYVRGSVLDAASNPWFFCDHRDRPVFAGSGSAGARIASTCCRRTTISVPSAQYVENPEKTRPPLDATAGAVFAVLPLKLIIAHKCLWTQSFALCPKLVKVRRALFLRHPGGCRDPFLPWIPAFAGMTKVLGSP
jgi:hypothetical protein